ncbi:hypothetical protein P3T36_007277 [Kitasatospora sp. MAP12-15]|uniref:hypothetical protein n=1 Tax=unclassified Kitasatospora TaxID=2633591 RepID=UPI002473489D|nr:hypothetical protein [Kitasatospora sp. MAP12-44]MDH6115660.1 hypothetical protein [Kitasatospora sp. MAP12-44]
MSKHVISLVGLQAEEQARILEDAIAGRMIEERVDVGTAGGIVFRRPLLTPMSGSEAASE